MATPRSPVADALLGTALFLGVIAGWPRAAGAQRPVPDAVVRGGTLSFDGRATTGDFTGTTSTVSGALTGAAALAGVTGWVEAPVATLVTGNDRRDRDLNKSLESEKYPTMRFDLREVRPEREWADSAAVVLRGSLTIRGISLEREIPARLAFGDQEIRVTASFPINLKDYRIGGLSKFLGVLRMHPDIDVHVDLVFAPSG